MCFSILLISCTDEIEIQQKYDFELRTMPVPKRISNGETVEIRCELLRSGYYKETKYYIRYFQPDGKGELRMDNGLIFLPNDLYSLDRDVFRLYYTSACSEAQTIDIYIQDSFGEVKQTTFSFSNVNETE